MLTVFNVGQGDAFLLEYKICLKDKRYRIFHHSCCNTTQFICCSDKEASNDLCNEFRLLVDTGPLSKKMMLNNIKDCIDVLITHSHKDHIGGLPYLLKTCEVERIYVPRYLPEVLAINKFLKKAKSPTLGTISRRHFKKIKLLSEGDFLAEESIEILNPPKSFLAYVEPSDYDFSEEEVRRAIRLLNEKFEMDLDINEILEYESPVNDREYLLGARKFVHSFFVRTYKQSEKFNISFESFKYFLHGILGLTANQASIVFKHKSNEGDWLFTGDADIKVFQRLIKKDPKILNAKYLKVPHHGSRENLNPEVLKAVNPEIAIVSHGNKAHGRSKDSHPHHEIVDLLDESGVIKTYYTNDVIKKRIVIKTKSSGKYESGLLDFV